jgi:hypothetical protein
VTTLGTTRARAKNREESGSKPSEVVKARNRRVLANEAEAMIEAGPETFGAFAMTEFAQDMLRARWDVEFFCVRFLGFQPHPGQIRLFDIYIKRDPSRWMARYLTVCAAAGNRAGKTLGLAVVVFHATLFKMGRKPPNPLDDRAVRQWARQAFEWYHFGVHGEVSELVYYEIVRLLSGTHEAQKNGCPLADMLGPDIADWSRKYRGEYLMIVLHDELGGGVIHFRTTGERAIGSLGKDMDGLSVDEAAFEPHFDFVFNEVLHFRRMSTGGQMFLIGTMTEGLTDFSDKWTEGDPTNPLRKTDTMSLRISTRENIGFGIDQEMFDRMIADYPPYLIPQNIDGFAIESRSSYFGSQTADGAFHVDLPETQPAKRGHRYAHGVDPAMTYDSTWGVVLDATAHPTVGVAIDRKEGRQTSLSVTALATNQHNAYDTVSSQCMTGVDATGLGGKMYRDQLPFNARMVEFGGTKGVKLRMLAALKQALEKGDLILPRHGLWLVLRKQLLAYKLDDRKIEQDAVMALAVAWYMTRYASGPTAQNVPFDFFAREDPSVVSGEALKTLLRRISGGT